MRNRLHLTLAAATLGWGLDAFDFTLFLFAIPQLTETFRFGTGFAGFILTCTLVCSAIGGLVFGVLADKLGRARMLNATIIIYSLASLGSATAQDEWQLLFWRCLLGLGMGGEWATGATLVAETWPVEKRNKALALMQSGWALGFIASALVSQYVLPEWGWRTLFAMGALPALVTFWIRSRVEEPEVWRDHNAKVHHAREAAETTEHDLAFFESLAGQVKELFDPRWRRAFIVATVMVASVMFGVWGFFTWLPSFLATPVEKGGAGLTFLKSVNWTIALQTGAFLGYISFGWVADWLGRKKAYALYVLMAAALAPVYVSIAKSGGNLMMIGPLTGLFGHGHFSGLAPMLSGLFPVHIRATAQSTIYNTGRGISASAPWLIGAMAERFGFTAPLVTASGFFVIAAFAVFLLPSRVTFRN